MQSSGSLLMPAARAVGRVEPMSDAVVVGVDGSEQAERALRWGAAEAAARNLPLHLVNGLDAMMGYYGGGLPIPQQTFDDLEQYAQRLLTEGTEAARAIGPNLVITTARAQVPAVP